jgi:hypothetical protein
MLPLTEEARHDQTLITPFRPADEARWRELWRRYLDFYETELPAERYDHTWRRLLAPDGAIRGFGARLRDPQAPLVGIAHYLFHAHAWHAREVCYLGDLCRCSGARPGLRRGAD